VLLGVISNRLDRIDKRIAKMATNVSELAPELAQIKSLVAEGMIELTQKIADLEVALGDAGALPDEAQIELDGLKTMAQALADVIANPPPIEPPVEPEV
jgi:hypothetical protein